MLNWSGYKNFNFTFKAKPDDIIVMVKGRNKRKKALCGKPYHAVII